MVIQISAREEGLIEKLHGLLNVGEKIEDAELHSPSSWLSGDSAVIGALGKRQKLKSIAEKKLPILEAVLNHLDFYGFLSPDVTYVDWCSGRGEIAYSIAYLVHSPVFRVDKRFPERNPLESIFPCTKDYGLQSIIFDLNTLRLNENVNELPENSHSKVTYLGLYCCGSLPDLIVRYMELQIKKPDLVAIVPCHYGEMDFELSILASNLQIGKLSFDLLRMAAANLENINGMGRKAMEIIDYCRAENLKSLGYDAKVLRLYPNEVSPFNHLIIGAMR